MPPAPPAVAERPPATATEGAEAEAPAAEPEQEVLEIVDDSCAVIGRVRVRFPCCSQRRQNRARRRRAV